MSASSGRRAFPTLAALALICLALPTPGLAAFPGSNGKIAFGGNGVETINPDGTGRTVLASDGWDPAWSPAGNKIAFHTNRDGNHEIYVMNADGSGQTRLTTNPAIDLSPEWSPDGSRIVFVSDRDGNSEIYTMNSDGSGQTRITNSTTGESSPAWSPAGDRIAFQGGYAAIYTMNVDGTGIAAVPSAYWWCSSDTTTKRDYTPDWSPSGQKLVFVHNERDYDCTEYDHWEVHTINADGSGEQNLFEDYIAMDPAWSPDGTRFVVGNAGGGMSVYDMSGNRINGFPGEPEFPCCPDWQPILPTQPGHARPVSATRASIKLVPAYEECTSPNSSHGPPLLALSCNPPQQASDHLTVGTGDANGAATNSTGYVSFRVFCHPPDVNGVPECPDPGDQIDVALTATFTDVRNKSDLTDYTGELRVSVSTRITDRFNLPGGVTRATVADTPVSFNVTCQSTTAETIGSTCSAATSADAVMPGVALEGKRAVWQLGQIQVYDGGSDGDADTTGDNTLFAVQGLFAQ